MLYTLYFTVGVVIGSVLDLFIKFLPKQKNMFEQINSARNFSRLRLSVLVPVIGSFVSG